MNSLTKYESTQCSQIQEWKNETPSVMPKTIDVVTKPVTWLINIIIPQKAIEGVLEMCNEVAEILPYINKLKKDANVQTLEELKHKDLELSDKLADQVRKWAIGVAVLEGAATGATGLKGMAVDIPALITIGLHVIHKIGACYGWTCQSEDDKMLVMSILSVAGSNTMKEKNAALLTLRQINTIIIKTTWKKMAENAAKNKLSKEAAIITVKKISKDLGEKLTKRKMKQALPIIGAGVGAAMNVAFINDIAWAARRTFQERWLIENNKIVVSD